MISVSSTRFPVDLTCNISAIFWTLRTTVRSSHHCTVMEESPRPSESSLPLRWDRDLDDFLDELWLLSFRSLNTVWIISASVLLCLASLPSCWVICVWGPRYEWWVFVVCLQLAMLFLPAVGPLFPAVVALFILGSLPWLFFLLSLSCAKHRRRCPRGHRSRGKALFPRASRPLSLYTFWPWSAVEVSWLARPFSSRLMFVTRLWLRTLDFCSRHCIHLTLCLVVVGQFSTNSAIDRPAEPVESPLPCSWQTLAPLHAGTRLATSLCRTPRARSLWGPCG